MLKPSMFQKSLRFGCSMKTPFWTSDGFCPDLLNHQGSLLQFKTFCRATDVSRNLTYLPEGDTCFFSPASYLNYSQKLCSYGIFIKALVPRQTSHKYNIATINIQNNLNYLCVCILPMFVFGSWF